MVKKEQFVGSEYYDVLDMIDAEQTSFSYCNPHPKGKEVNDCVKRAITIATEKDYMQVQRELNRLKRKLGETKYNKDKVWKTYLKDYERVSIPAIKGYPRPKVVDFIEKHPRGTYILSLSKHLATVKDGVLLDIYDCSYKTVFSYYIIEGGDE